MKAQLIAYSSQINKFYTSDVLAVLDCTFVLSEEEKEEIRNLLDNYYQPISKYPWKDRKILTKEMKSVSEKVWNRYIKDKSIIESPFSRIIEIIEHSKRPDCLKENLVHSLCRLGEFFYLTDDEMNIVGENLDAFIELGDCKLFDGTDCPYKDEDLKGDIIQDIISFENHIQNYLDKEGLPILEAKDITTSLDQIKNWVDKSNYDSVPSEIRGVIQVFREIRKEIHKECHRVGSYLNSHGSHFEDQDLISKLSGFCLNKETDFQEFLNQAGMPGWKNPEGSFLYGNSNIPINPTLLNNMYKIDWWDMDCIYYSIGKGPWDKCRYVGQPCALFQNIAEPGARCVKTVIKRQADKYQKQAVGLNKNLEGHTYDPSSINIYENYDSLLDLLTCCDDFIAMDYSSYSDYLCRDIFPWIMDNLLGFPKWYSDQINHLMALPIKVNGNVYPHKHASVMGIKFNFLLITIANWIMWAIGCNLTGKWDKSKFMGDDRIQGRRGEAYSSQEVGIMYAVTAFFNCVVNPSKSEHMDVDGSTSFCKRTFNRRKEQISGFSGEYLMKQKPFLNDVSVWLNLCYHNQIPVSYNQLAKWVRYWAPYYKLTYGKFMKKSDPDLGDMANILRKIPYEYGGWSLEEPDDTLERIMLRSVLALVDEIFLNMDKDMQNIGREKIRQWVKYHSLVDLQYYNFLTGATSYNQDYERIASSIASITRVLERKSNSIVELKEARASVQRIMEIVLTRDSRLANSTSTKNRIDYSFDQDRVSKIRAKYLFQAIEESRMDIETSLVESSVLNDSLKEKGIHEGMKDYMKYLGYRLRSGGRITIYDNAVYDSWLALEVYRTNPDGSKRVFYKRLESQDSSYERIYRNSEGYYLGKFVTYQDLTKDEQSLCNYLQKGETKHIICNINQALNRVVDNMEDYLINRLADLLYN